MKTLQIFAFFLLLGVIAWLLWLAMTDCLQSHGVLYCILSLA